MEKTKENEENACDNQTWQGGDLPWMVAITWPFDDVFL